MHRWINDQPQLRRTLIAWIRATFLRRNPYTAELAHVDTLEELSMSWNERMAQWAEADREEGLQKGRQEGREDGVRLGSARALLKLLQKRFGPLAAAVQTQVNTAPLAQIEAWFDHVIDAPSLDAVLSHR
jgi:flagellar biosynthesis/type III secretory pathway protein FliH